MLVPPGLLPALSLSFVLTHCLSCSKNVCSSKDPDFIVTELGSSLDETVLQEPDIPFSGDISVSTADGTQLYKSYGYERKKADCETGIGNSYWIASLSKQFCASAILLLQEQGHLQVDGKLSDYLPGIAPDKADITLHQLLTHTSGLEDAELLDGIASRKDAIDALNESSVSAELVNSYKYSNLGYQILAIVVEVLSGDEYHSFLHKNFFDKLGMRESGSSGDQQSHYNLNVAERGRRSKRKANGNPQNWTKNYAYQGSTGVLTSTRDLHTWFNALRDGHVLSAGSIELLFSKAVVKDDDIHYGYGWNIISKEDGEIWVHSGDDDFIAHSSTLRYYPKEDALIIVLSNAGYHDDTPVARAMAVKLVEALF